MEKIVNGVHLNHDLIILTKLIQIEVKLSRGSFEKHVML